LPTDYRGIAELGIISGSSMFFALAATFTVLPATLVTFGWVPGNSRRDSVIADIVLRAERATVRRPRLVVGLAFLVGLAALTQAFELRFDDDPLNLRDPDSEAVALFLHHAKEGNLEPYVGEMLLPDLTIAGEVADKLARLNGVRETRYLADLVPDGQEEKLAVIERLSLSLSPALSRPRSPALDAGERKAAAEDFLETLRRPDNPFHEESAGLIARLDEVLKSENAARLATLEMIFIGDFAHLMEDLELALAAEPVRLETLPEDLRGLWVTPDGKARVEVLPDRSLLDGEARADFVTELQKVAPQINGTPVVIHEAGRVVVQAFLEALIYAVLAIFILLTLRLRSPVDALLVLAPLALAGLVTLVVANALGWHINFANVIVLPLLFGLGVDSGIHMVSRARSIGGDGEEGRTLKAILLSSLTTLASFGVLSFSVHPGTASMGRLLTLAIFFGLVSTLLVLPAALTLRKRGK
ncbi:MAG: MMPL family transporter, partial [Kiloniellales bacterium]|nr:MMPL family transporter [Kiloniellales bacterium]